MIEKVGNLNSFDTDWDPDLDKEVAQQIRGRDQGAAFLPESGTFVGKLFRSKRRNLPDSNRTQLTSDADKSEHPSAQKTRPHLSVVRRPRG